MAEIASSRAPGDLVIVAHATILSVTDFSHGNIVGTNPHFKSQLVMTNLAAKTNAVEPVRENHRTNIIFVGKPVQHHIGILGRRINAEAGVQDDKKHNKSLASD